MIKKNINEFYPQSPCACSGKTALTWFLLIFILISSNVRLTAGAVQTDGSQIRPFNILFDLDGVFQSLSDLFDLVSNLPKKIAESFIEILVSEMMASVKEQARSATDYHLDSLDNLVKTTNSFIQKLTFAIAEFSFLLGLGLYIVPVHFVTTRYAAMGKKIAQDSLLIAFTSEYQGLIISFMRSFADSLTWGIQNSHEIVFEDSLESVFLNLNASGLVLVIVLFLTSLVMLVILTSSLLLETLSPIIFNLALLFYCLPIGKEVGNKMAVSSLFYFLLKPLTWGLIVLNTIILSELVSVLTPIIICVLDFFILWYFFKISSSTGAQYPILDQLGTGLGISIQVGTVLALSKIGVFTGRNKR